MNILVPKAVYDTKMSRVLASDAGERVHLCPGHVRVRPPRAAHTHCEHAWCLARALCCRCWFVGGTRKGLLPFAARVRAAEAALPEADWRTRR